MSDTNWLISRIPMPMWRISRDGILIAGVQDTVGPVDDDTILTRKHLDEFLVIWMGMFIGIIDLSSAMRQAVTRP